MRVLLAVHGFPPLQNTGAERAAERIATWLVSHGHYVEVFTIGSLDQDIPHVVTTEQGGFRVHRLSFNSHSGNEFLNLYDNPLVGAAIKPVLEQGNFDLMHMISGYLLGGQAVRAARRAGLPVVITLTEFFFMCPRLNLMHANSSLCVGPESTEKCARCVLEDKRRYYYLNEAAPVMADKFWSMAQNTDFAQRKNQEVQLRQQVLHNTLEQVDLVIAPSRFILEKYAEFGYAHPRSIFIQHGVNRAQDVEPVLASETPRRMRFGFMGQIKPHKGVDLVVEAMKVLLDAGRQVELAIWGRSKDDPEYYRNLQRSARAHDAIHFCGAFDGARVWNVLQEMDVLVVPSRWFENCPTVILEAFKMRVPVIATNMGGMAELVQHEHSGLTFAVNDAEDLRAQMERIISEPGLYPRLQQGIPYIKDGSEEIEEIYAQYQSLLAEKNQPVA